MSEGAGDMSGTRTTPVSKPEFDRVYDKAILNRRFVEDLDYYPQARRRFWDGIRRIDALNLPAGARVIDIGGGITGVLMHELFGFDVTIADVNERARGDVEAMGLNFTLIDISRDNPPVATDLDLVVLQEVIEHIPQPPYVVLRRLAAMLAPGGYLFLTTPNGHRFRNLVYMAFGREILDIYRYPGEGEGLGHQHEYTLKQMLWQAREAGFEITEAETYRDGWRGATPVAKVARFLSIPAELAVPHMRNAIAMTLRRPVVDAQSAASP